MFRRFLYTNDIGTCGGKCKDWLKNTRSIESTILSNHSEQKYPADLISGYLDVDVGRAAAENDGTVYDTKLLNAVQRKD